MKKRILSLFLGLSVIASTLTGCTSAATNSPETTASGASGTTVTNTDGDFQKFDDVKLDMLVCWNGGFKTAPDQYNNEIAQAIRDKIGVTVNFEETMMDETEKLNLMFASGDMPDMVSAPYWGGDTGETAVIKKAASEGLLLPIENYFDEYPIIAQSYQIGVISQQYYDADLAPPEFNNHLYLIPCQTPGSEDDISNWAYGVFVRGDVAQTLGIDPSSIKTFDQLYDFMQQAQNYGFKDVNGNDAIVATTFHSGWSYGEYVANFDHQKLTKYVQMPDGSVSYDELQPAWIDKNLALWKMVNSGILDKECFKQSDEQADTKVGNGTALFVACQYGPVVTATQKTGLYNAHPEMRYVPVGPMNDADGNPLVQISTNGRTGTPAVFFPNTCSNIDAALTYISYLNTEEGARLAEYGIEGETYSFNDAGQPRLNQDILDRKKAGDPTVNDELTSKGIGYMDTNEAFDDLRQEWWGESEPGAADAAVPEIEAYKQARPAVVYDGYPISAFENTYPDYDKLKTFAFDTTTEDDYCQKAYFADTEDEARQILESYQNYLTTTDDGMFLDFLDYMTQMSTTRDDIVY